MNEPDVVTMVYVCEQCAREQLGIQPVLPGVYRLSLRPGDNYSCPECGGLTFRVVATEDPPHVR